MSLSSSKSIKAEADKLQDMGRQFVDAWKRAMETTPSAPMSRDRLATELDAARSTQPAGSSVIDDLRHGGKY